jgi:outer membrane protein assembly factor BamB
MATPAAHRPRRDRRARALACVAFAVGGACARPAPIDPGGARSAAAAAPLPTAPLVAAPGQPAICPASPASAPPSTAPSPRRPIDHLAPAWRSAGAIEQVLAGGAIVVDTDGRHRVVDARTGEARQLLDAAWRHGPSWRPRFVVAGRHLAVLREASLSGVSLDADALAWTVPVEPWPPEGLIGLGRDGWDALLLAASGEVKALDAATGSVRWTLPVPGVTPPDRVDLHRSRWLATAPRLIARSDDGVAAIDAERGCLLWNRKLPRFEGRFLAADERHVVVGERELTVYRAATGERVASFARSDQLCTTCEGEVGAALVGGVLVMWWASSTGTMAGIAPTDGRTLWLQRPSLREVAVGDDVVFTRSEHGVVRALDPSTGEARWTGFAENEWVTRLWAIPDLPGGAGLALTANDGIALFARAEAPPPSSFALVEGTLRVDGRAGAGLHVLVGDDVVEADAAGRFAARVPAHGKIIVQAATVDARLRGDPIRCIEFDGTARAVVALESGGPRHPVKLDFRTREVRCPDQ